MTNRGEMDTLSTVLRGLRIKGQDHEFLISKDGMVTSMGKLYKPQEITIIKTYRFEGESDPSEEAIVYLVQANDGSIGYSMDAYGIYTNHDQ
jgi:hypothetical protein